MKTLVITGGIGSGKSAAAAHLSRRGFPVYDSDASAKTLYERCPEVVDALEERLGMSLRDAEGRLDRARLAGRIFSDPAARAAVESVVHPAVLEDFRSWRSLQHAPIVVIESAIILSKPLFDGEYDKVILIEAPEDVRVARAAQRDGVPEETVRARIAAQSFDLSKVDMVIRNDGSLDELGARLDRALPYLFGE